MLKKTIGSTWYDMITGLENGVQDLEVIELPVASWRVRVFGAGIAYNFSEQVAPSPRFINSFQTELFPPSKPSSYLLVFYSSRGSRHDWSKREARPR